MQADFIRSGQAAVRARDGAVAVQWFQRAVEAAPDDSDARGWLGQALCEEGRQLDGVTELRQAAEGWLAGSDATGRIDRALDLISRLQHWSDFEGALDLVRRAATAAPGHARCHQLLAVTCGQLNLTGEALSAGEAALALNPDHAMMQVLQASLEADAGRLEAAERRLTGLLERGLPDREAFHARKETARVADSLGRYAEVFPHLRIAAAIAERLPEWRSQDRTLIPRLIATNTGACTEDDLGRWSHAGLPRPPAVHAFVVGFFRCGTTLTQEVLAAHPDIFVADEANLVWRVQQALHRRDPGPDSVANKLKRLDAEGVAHLRAVYWEAVTGRYGAASERPVFVDKYTMNTLDLGLINTLFPDARVIFAIRNPRDVCLSAHMQLMRPSPATAGLLTWQGSVDLYARTMDWWRHIRDRLTMPVLELRYEEVVADFEPTYRRVFEFLDLAWDPAAANFHTRAHGRFVASPSRNQVARPLYASSVARWRRYEGEFTEVADLLDPLVASLGYSA